VLGGIDLGGAKIQTVVVDDDWFVRGKTRDETPFYAGPAGVAAAMADALRRATADAGVEPQALAGVGIGSPGDVDDRAGTVSSARNLPGWEGTVDLRSALEPELGCPISLGNDVQVATNAEFEVGAGREFNSLLGVFWGTGVGGGIVLDGKPWVGRGGGGELGHIVVKMGGARCTCGRRGCLEAYAGRASMEAHARRRHKAGTKTVLFKLMEEHGRDRLTSGIWSRALARDDELARKLIDRAVEALGAGVASVVNVLDVETVVIGGGLDTRLGEPYVKRIAKAMKPHIFVSDRPPDVVPAALGDLGGAIGASLLVKEPKRSGRSARAKAAS
jgi:glucokinase